MNISQISVVARIARNVPIQTTAIGMLARITVAAEGDAKTLTATQTGILARINSDTGWTPRPKTHKQIHGSNAFDMMALA